MSSLGTGHAPRSTGVALPHNAPDLVLAGGEVADGEHPTIRRADVAITGDRIATVAPGLDGRAARAIDVSGHVVAPGFIDIHTHSDLTLLDHPEAHSKLLQGVTTEVIGNCGFSPFPVVPDRRPLHDELMAGAGPSRQALDWTDLTGWAQRIEQTGVAVNVVPLVGHGALRIAACGVGDGPATPGELAIMRRHLEHALDQGAFGLSTGLTYVPSRYGDRAEIAALAALVARRERLYATHSRGITEHWTAAVDEAVEIGRRTGARVQFSHLAINDPRRWEQAGTLLARFDEAVADGVDIAFDVYPYDASASSLTQYLPAWVSAGGTAGLRARLADPATRGAAETAVTQGWGGGVPWDWERVVIAALPGPDGGIAGRSIADLAAGSGRRPAQVVLELCGAFGNAVQVALFSRSDDDVRAFLRHRLAVVGSDGATQALAGDGVPHPRSFGTHPRVLARHVRDLGDLRLGEAVARMTGRVARRLGLRDRGHLRAGQVADVVVFDPAEVRDTATFTRPRSAPLGVTHVFVAGRAVLRDGVPTGDRPGRVLGA